MTINTYAFNKSLHAFPMMIESLVTKWNSIQIFGFYLVKDLWCNRKIWNDWSMFNDIFVFFPLYNISQLNISYYNIMNIIGDRNVSVKFHNLTFLYHACINTKDLLNNRRISTLQTYMHALIYYHRTLFCRHLIGFSCFWQPNNRKKFSLYNIHDIYCLLT